MGNYCFTPKVASNEDFGWATWENLFQILSFTEEEFETLYKPFSSLRRKNEDKLAISELASYYGFADDPHIIRCFSLFDKDHHGLVSFGEFFLCLWNYCTHNLETHLLFTFLACDESNEGCLPVHELREGLRQCFESAEHANLSLWPSVEQLIVGVDDVVDYSQFAQLIISNYDLFSWAFRLRMSFVNQFWDSVFWKKKSGANIVLLLDSNEIPLSSNTVLQFKSKGLQNFEHILNSSIDCLRAGIQEKPVYKLNRGSLPSRRSFSTLLISSASEVLPSVSISESESLPREDIFSSGIPMRENSPRRGGPAARIYAKNLLHTVSEENSLVMSMKF